MTRKFHLTMMTKKPETKVFFSTTTWTLKTNFAYLRDSKKISFSTQGFSCYFSNCSQKNVGICPLNFFFIYHFVLRGKEQCKLY